MSRSARLETVLVLTLASFAFVNALCWAIVIPPGDAPDEPGHFEVVAFESVFREIPEFGVDDYGTMAKIAPDGYRSPLNTYSAQPGLSYLVSVLAIDLFENRAVEPAQAARYPGALWATAMTIVVFIGVRAMFPDRGEVAVLAATIVTCWPQLTFVFAYVNNDGLTALACAALIATWFVGRGRGWRYRDSACLGFTAGLVLLNKPNGFPLVPVAVVVFLLGLQGPWMVRFRKMAIAAATGLATAGWWYVIAYRRYGWDLLATARADHLREELGVVWASGRYYGMSPLETAFADFPRFGETWIAGTLRSAVGVFGELTIALPDRSYALIAVLCLAGLVGIFVTVRQATPGRGQVGWPHTVTALLVPTFLGLSLYRSWAQDFQAQGRYLFPAMLPFAAFLAFGLLGSLRGRRGAVAGFGGSLILVAVMVDAFVVRLLGAYRQTFGDLFEATPVLAASWCVALVTFLGVGTLYWLRMWGAGNGAQCEQSGQCAAE